MTLDGNNCQDQALNNAKMNMKIAYEELFANLVFYLSFRYTEKYILENTKSNATGLLVIIVGNKYY